MSGRGERIRLRFRSGMAEKKGREEKGGTTNEAGIKTTADADERTDGRSHLFTTNSLLGGARNGRGRKKKKKRGGEIIIIIAISCCYCSAASSSAPDGADGMNDRSGGSV